jgi:hypothetical protein
LVLEFEALLNNLKAELESEQERLASVGGKLSPFKQRYLEELLRKMPRMRAPISREYWASRLRWVVGARLWKPERMLESHIG